jgi:hypothetical protein
MSARPDLLTVMHSCGHVAEGVLEAAARRDAAFLIVQDFTGGAVIPFVVRDMPVLQARMQLFHYEIEEVELAAYRYSGNKPN